MPTSPTLTRVRSPKQFSPSKPSTTAAATTTTSPSHVPSSAAASHIPPSHSSPKPNLPMKKPRPPLNILPPAGPKNKNVLNLSIDTAGLGEANKPSQPPSHIHKKTNRHSAYKEKQDEVHTDRTAASATAPTVSDPNALSPLSPNSPVASSSSRFSNSDNESNKPDLGEPVNKSTIEIRRISPSIRQSQQPSPADDVRGSAASSLPERRPPPPSSSLSSTYTADNVVQVFNEAFFNTQQKMLREQSLMPSQLENLQEVLLREVKTILYKPPEPGSTTLDYPNNASPSYSPRSHSHSQASARSISDSSYATCQDVRRSKEGENSQSSIRSSAQDEGFSMSPDSRLSESPTIVLPPPDEDPGEILCLMPRSPSGSVRKKKRGGNGSSGGSNNRGKPAPLPTPKNSEQSFDQSASDVCIFDPQHHHQRTCPTSDGVSTLTPKQSKERDNWSRTPSISVSSVGNHPPVPPPHSTLSGPGQSPGQGPSRRYSVFTFAKNEDQNSTDRDDARSDHTAQQASSSGSSSDTPVASPFPSQNYLPRNA